MGNLDKWGNLIEDDEWGTFKVMGRHERNDEWTWVASFANEEDVQLFIRATNSLNDGWEYDYEAL